MFRVIIFLHVLSHTILSEWRVDRWVNGDYNSSNVTEKMRLCGGRFLPVDDPAT